jgi:cellulose synthase/poly-beta-1,6-N-acetylglucosamine synthase-like glycosyltransferase
VKAYALAAVAAGTVLPLLAAYCRGRAARGLVRWRNQPAPAEWPTVSVIIPAWRERGTLDDCLTHVRRVDYPPFEIIVAAGGLDGTYERALRVSEEDRRIRVIPQRAEGGKNGAMNDAVPTSTGAVLVFLDADSEVSPGWLKALVAALGSDGCGEGYAASTGRLVPMRRTLISRLGEMGQALEYEARGRVSLQGSSSVAVRRAAWDAVGELPEGPYADDWDLNARLHHAGMQVSYARAAVVRTEAPATLREWWANELRWRRIHLTSLLRVARAKMTDKRSAVRALYPYIAGWTIALLGAAALALRLLGWKSRLLESAWLLLAAPALAREMSGALETTAFSGDASWLSELAVIPGLTALGWVAAVIATVTRHRAPIHFKGPRPSMTKQARVEIAS